jgi:hypothetical protein
MDTRRPIKFIHDSTGPEALRLRSFDEPFGTNAPSDRRVRVPDTSRRVHDAPVDRISRLPAYASHAVDRLTLLRDPNGRGLKWLHDRHEIGRLWNRPYGYADLRFDGSLLTRNRLTSYAGGDGGNLITVSNLLPHIHGGHDHKPTLGDARSPRAATWVKHQTRRPLHPDSLTPIPQSRNQARPHIKTAAHADQKPCSRGGERKRRPLPFQPLSRCSHPWCRMRHISRSTSPLSRRARKGSGARRASSQP